LHWAYLLAERRSSLGCVSDIAGLCSVSRAGAGRVRDSPQWRFSLVWVPHPWHTGPFFAFGSAEVLGAAVLLAWLFALQLIILERFQPDGGLAARADYYRLVEGSFFLALILTLSWLIIGNSAVWRNRAWWPAALVALSITDLFSATMGTNWEPVAASERTLIGPYVDPVLRDGDLFRVDAEYGLGRLGPGENYGTLLGIQDIRGTSPLRLSALEDYLRFQVSPARASRCEIRAL
jgi:hypothetical protein